MADENDDRVFTLEAELSRVLERLRRCELCLGLDPYGGADKTPVTPATAEAARLEEASGKSKRIGQPG